VFSAETSVNGRRYHQPLAQVQHSLQPSAQESLSDRSMPPSAGEGSRRTVEAHVSPTKRRF
jgi:hypothetical protein